MKLYYFNPNDYGEEWFVVANSEDEAINHLNKHLLQKFEKNPDGGTKPLKWGDSYFQKKVLPNGVVLRNGYTIDIYEEGQVVETEIS